MIRLCENCKVLMKDEDTENGRCPTCGLRMVRWEVLDVPKHIEFDLMLSALLHGERKPQ